MRASSRSRSTNLASWFAERAGERFDEEAVLLAAGAWVADELRAKSPRSQPRRRCSAGHLGRRRAADSSLRPFGKRTWLHADAA